MVVLLLSLVVEYTDDTGLQGLNLTTDSSQFVSPELRGSPAQF